MTSFAQWIGSFAWLHEQALPCVISPDLDGIACAALQVRTLRWRVVGTYDGTDLCLFTEPGRVDWARVVFLDMEILRAGVRSIGNHLLGLDREDNERLRAEFPDCANPNLWRGIAVEPDFQRKYPFATLPLLLAAAAQRDRGFDVSEAWVALGLHTDSGFTNAAMYQANALDWLEAMGAGAEAEGIGRLCRRLGRLRAVEAVGLLQRVQGWAEEAGMGAKRRACRFRPFDDRELERGQRLAERVWRETGGGGAAPVLGDRVVFQETFETKKYDLDSKKKRRASFERAREERVVSMAATGRTTGG